MKQHTLQFGGIETSSLMRSEQVQASFRRFAGSAVWSVLAVGIGMRIPINLSSAAEGFEIEALEPGRNKAIPAFKARKNPTIGRGLG